MFLTIKKSGSAIYKEKGSKFLAIAIGCTTPDQATEILAKTRKENFGCVHLCYAYRLGSEKINLDLVMTEYPLIMLVFQYLGKLSLLN